MRLKKEADDIEYQFEFQLALDGYSEVLIVEKLIVENLASKEEFIEIIKRVKPTKILKLQWPDTADITPKFLRESFIKYNIKPLMVQI